MSSQGKKFVDNIGRKKWDLEEFKEKAKEKEAQSRRSETTAFGDKESKAVVIRTPLQARDYSVDLFEKVGKYSVITGNTPLSGRGGFYCDVCDCLLKDSITYMNHINGKQHQQNLGMSMNVERSTVAQVKKKFEDLKRQSEEKKQAESVEERLARFEQQMKDKKKRKKAERADEDAERRQDEEDDEEDYSSRRRHHSYQGNNDDNSSGNFQNKSNDNNSDMSHDKKRKRDEGTKSNEKHVPETKKEEEGEEEELDAETLAEQQAMAAMGFVTSFGTSSKKK